MTNLSGKKLTQEQKDEIWRLYSKENFNPTEISRIVGVSQSSAYVYSVGRKNGFNSPSEYQEYFIKERGFNSSKDYVDYLAKKKGCKSHVEYATHLRRKKGVKPRKIKLKKINSEYQNNLKKLANNDEYSEIRLYKNVVRESNIFGRALLWRIHEVGMNQEKFAEKVEMDFTAISRYIHGRAFPNEKNFKKIWNELGISYNTLEEFLENIS